MAPAPSDSPRSSRGVLQQRPFSRFLSARVATSVAFQMQGVAVGWQIYALTGSAWYLGLVGLAQFIPMLMLTLMVGHVADRHDRRLVARICQVAEGAGAALLALGSLGGWLNKELLLAIVFVMGAARAFEGPTMQALLPTLVPSRLLPRALAWSASAHQSATIIGPALGGLLYAAGPATVYATASVLFLSAGLLVGTIPSQSRARREPADLASLFAGIDYIRRNPAILGAISLDLFAVLLGGATALLPIYARDILKTGVWGLGLLRSAPAVGALAMSLYLARHPLRRRVGRIMFASVALFGLATIVFALSRSFTLSLLALLVLGGADVVSVVIRSSLVQIRTPDEMRGRVSAVNFMFIGTSNQLGEFESGATAALFGTVPATLLGGVGTLLVVLIWMRLFPQLLEADTLEKRPPRAAAGAPTPGR